MQFYGMNGAATLTPTQSKILEDYDLLYTLSPALLKLASGGILFLLMVSFLPFVIHCSRRGNQARDSRR
jgi:hypothetical protein